MAATLDLSGGRLDLKVVAGRDAAFVLPTPSDLSGYTWAGVVRATTESVSPLGSFTITVDSSKASVLIPRTLTAVLPQRSIYEITVTGNALDTSLLSGTIFCDAR